MPAMGKNGLAITLGIQAFLQSMTASTALAGYVPPAVAAFGLAFSGALSAAISAYIAALRPFSKEPLGDALARHP